MSEENPSVLSSKLPSPSGYVHLQDVELERDRARAQNKLQLRMLPLLILPIGLTAYLACNRASELGPSWFAFREFQF